MSYASARPWSDLVAEPEVDRVLADSVGRGVVRICRHFLVLRPYAQIDAQRLVTDQLSCTNTPNTLEFTLPCVMNPWRGDAALLVTW